MPFPPGVETVTLTGHQTLADGNGRPLPVHIRPVPRRVVSATHGVVIDNDLVIVRPAADGQWTVTLLATDAAACVPTGWTYRVETGGDAIHISLPAALGSIDIAALTPAGADTGDYVLVPGPPGPAGLSAYQVAVANGFVGTEAQWLASLQTDADAYTDAAVAAHAGAADPHADRAYANSTFATITVVNNLNNTVITLNGFMDDIFARLAAIEQGTAFLAGVNSTGNVTVTGGDLQINGTGKAYRFRRGGGGLDYEGAGADLLFSMWENANFSGAQRSYDRYSPAELTAQHAGKREFVDALYGATRHVIDGTANQTGWYGAAPVGRQNVTGSRADGTALVSLLTALANLGWITDNTTA